MGYLGSGIVQDAKARLPWYGSDWRSGFTTGRILAPATFIFLASALPAVAFGQQLADETGGTLNVVHVLISTAISGIVQAVLGGQPLLIIGVAEPIVLIYGFMYSFAAGQPSLGTALFLPWAAWVCVWTSVLVLLLAVLNSCALIDKFTRFSGELFGMLIAILFMQVGIKGLISEFNPPVHADPTISATPEAATLGRLANGLWAVILSLGLLYTAILTQRARTWRFLRGWARALLADYGCPIAFVAWTALSFAVRGVPGAPRRVQTPNTWEIGASSWGAAGRMGEVPPEYIGAALVPALVIAVLFFFDHNVSSQMAQQAEFNLKKPAAYHYDFMLLGLLTLLCGLLGLPPVNGVLPQAPMHTRTLATLKAQETKASMKQAASKAALSEANNNDSKPPSEGMPELQLTPTPTDNGMRNGTRVAAVAAAAGTAATAAGGLRRSEGSRVALVGGDASEGADAVVVNGRGEAGDVLPVEVNEQRVSGLLQSLFVAICLGLTPAIKLVPTAVLWGYFAFMSLESLPGSQFWERLLLLVTDPKRRYVVLEREHAAYLQLVNFRTVAIFTLMQFALLMGVWALTTFGGIASFLFPLPIMALVPIRQYVLPRIFNRADLQQLDAAEYEEAPGLPHEVALQDAAGGGLIHPASPSAADDEAAEREAALLEGAYHGLQLVHHISADEVQRRQRVMRQGELLGLDGEGAAAAAAAGGVGREQQRPRRPGSAHAWGRGEVMLFRRHSHEV